LVKKYKKTDFSVRLKGYKKSLTLIHWCLASKNIVQVGYRFCTGGIREAYMRDVGSIQESYGEHT
jgi:hypothetical protein